MSEICQERHRLDQERREAMRRLMADFDKQHFAKVRELQTRCAKIGHVRGQFHDNGLGWSWYYCNQCGVAFEKEGPMEVSK
jgi:hypothetical protein